MCKTAKKILKKWIKNPNFLTIPTEYRANYEYILREIDDKFLPDANKILGNWYKNEAAYDYFEETLPKKETGKFIELHIMFIITFLDLLVNIEYSYYIKYRNTVTIYM